MTEFRSIQCPSCGAQLEVPFNLGRISCINCGGSFEIPMETVTVKNQAQEVKRPCPDCAGKGYFFCRTCNGTGRCFSYAMNVNEGIAKYCLSGWCPRCNGQGQYIQLVFSETCTNCMGTRVCPACRGTGRCYACSGFGKTTCARCKGTGIVV